MKVPIAIHLTARTRYGCRPFNTPKTCEVLWTQLKRAFPRCYAAVLMPNHFHLVVPGVEMGTDLRWRVGVVLRSVSRTLGPDLVQWEAAAAPQILVDRAKAVTMIRYVHLNPARARLNRDPLAWRWSTLREFVLAYSLWGDAHALADLHEVPLSRLPQAIGRFTLSDEFCSPEARAPLLPWSQEFRPSPQRLKAALELICERVGLGPHQTPILVRASFELRALTLTEIAQELGMSFRGAQKALLRFDEIRDGSNLSILRTLVANPRLLGDSVAESS